VPAYFLDTSALFKRYQEEAGTLRVQSLFDSADARLLISSLCLIEAVSNLKRLCDVDGLTTSEQFLLQRSQFFQDIIRGALTVVDFTPDHILRAETLISRRYMKPIDALQLAIALELQLPDITFVCADAGLCRRAREEGLLTLNPEEVEQPR
jgi:predicted nucleic acid-binding protein